MELNYQDCTDVQQLRIAIETCKKAYEECILALTKENELRKTLENEVATVYHELLAGKLLELSSDVNCMKQVICKMFEAVSKYTLAGRYEPSSGSFTLELFKESKEKMFLKCDLHRNMISEHDVSNFYQQASAEEAVEGYFVTTGSFSPEVNDVIKKLPSNGPNIKFYTFSELIESVRPFSKDMITFFKHVTKYDVKHDRRQRLTVDSLKIRDLKTLSVEVRDETSSDGSNSYTTR